MRCDAMRYVKIRFGWSDDIGSAVFGCGLAGGMRCG